MLDACGAAQVLDFILNRLGVGALRCGSSLDQEVGATSLQAARDALDGA